MMRIRRSDERGRAQHGWLDSRHTFSFGDYYDPAHMGFRDLRVINEDRVVPGAGFPTHPHRDMEILSYVLEGGLEHEDSMGNGSVIRPGEVQRMTAGTGVTHSEYNHSREEPVHFLQIWILPEARGLEPGYEQKRFDPQGAHNRLLLVASRDGREGSITVHQDVAVHVARLDEGAELAFPLASGRHAWVQVARGSVELEGERIDEGDGAGLSDVNALHVKGLEAAEVLVFDLK